MNDDRLATEADLNVMWCGCRITDFNGQPAISLCRLHCAATDLLAACEAALAVIPNLEVRSWPPGHKMKDDALTLLRSAIAFTKGTK